MLKQTSPNELDAMLLLDAQVLLERGWCQAALQIGDNFCALGAINMAATGHPCSNDVDQRFGAYNALAATIGSDGLGGIVNWNNARGRTQAEVVEAFGRAAELARVSA